MPPPKMRTSLGAKDLREQLLSKKQRKTRRLYSPFGCCQQRRTIMNGFWIDLWGKEMWTKWDLEVRRMFITGKMKWGQRWWWTWVILPPRLAESPNRDSKLFRILSVIIITWWQLESTISIIFNTCCSPRRRGRILPGQSEDCWSCFWSCAWRSRGLTFSSWILYFRFFGDFSNIRKDGRRVLFWEYVASSGFQSLIQFQNEDMEDAILYESFTEKFLHCDSTWNQTNIFTSKLHFDDTNN